MEEEELNRDSYKAASGLIYRASDCNVSASVRRKCEASLWYFHILAGQLISQ